MANIADARVVARFGDALILVVRSGVTSRDAAQLAKTRFAEDGIPILGTILNFWNPKTPGYGYYRYYYDGYYHYHARQWQQQRQWRQQRLGKAHHAPRPTPAGSRRSAWPEHRRAGAEAPTAEEHES